MMVTPPPSPPSPPKPLLQPQEEQHLEPAALIPLDHHHHDHQSLDEHNVSLNNVSLVQSSFEKGEFSLRSSQSGVTRFYYKKCKNKISCPHTNTHTRKVTYRPKHTILTVCLLVFFMR